MVAIPWKRFLPSSKHLSGALVARVELRGPILSAQAGHQLSIYCKELFGRNSPHLASVNSAYKIYGEMLSKDRWKTTSGFFVRVIPLLSQL
jgi:hypothetical protein